MLTPLILKFWNLVAVLHTLVKYVFNNSVNLSTGVTVENTLHNRTLTNIIITACRVSDEPVSLASLTTHPEIFQQIIYDMLFYLQNYNKDNIKSLVDVQTEASYRWLESVLLASNLFKTFKKKMCIVYFQSILNNIGALLRFYDNHFTSLRMLNCIGRQRADSEITDIFVTGGKKYLKRELKQTGRDAKKGNRKRRKKKPNRGQIKRKTDNAYTLDLHKLL